ncbi:kinase-like domain-containing protein [Cunninghamella echinulata]|nr:kinase-like domain-containing protein [Cunninghamella echinulata]
MTIINEPIYYHNEYQKYHAPTTATPPRKKHTKEAGDYWLGRTLGKGSSGRVKIGYHKITGEKVAVKIISKSYLSTNATTERSVKREIAIMKLIQHPHIVRLIDVIDVEDSPNLYLILEYVPKGELFEYLVTKGRLSENEAKTFFRQIVSTLSFCHQHLICHRDLKPENLLLDENNNIKIADFGMAKLQPNDGTLLETSCGSPHYASPEIVTGVRYNGPASDIWSCGVILFALLCGRLPFDDCNIRELLRKVKIGKYELPNHLSDPAKDLIQKILVTKPDQRITMDQIHNHDWFKSNTDGTVYSIQQPSLASPEDIGRPIKNRSEIDEQLLETLKVLWTNRPVDQLIEALLNRSFNMEKVAYTLLLKHSNKYWQMEHDDDEDKNAHNKHHLILSQKIRQRPTTICGVFEPSKKEIIGENEINKAVPVALPPPGIQSNSKHNNMNPFLPVQIPRKSLQRKSMDRFGCSPIAINNKRNRRLSQPPVVLPKPVLENHHLDNNTNNADKRKSTPTTFTYNDHHYTSQQQWQLNTEDNLTEQIRHNSSSLSSPKSPSPSLTTADTSSFSSLATSSTSSFTRFDLRNRLSQFINLRNDPTAIRSPSSSSSKKTKHRMSAPVSFHPPIIQQQQQLQTNNQESSISKALSKQSLSHISPSPRLLRNNKILPSHPLMCDSSPLLATKPLVAPSSSQITTIAESPRLSWLPGLFHFKKPKVCSINCFAKDENEAIGKISQIIQEHMNGYILEQRENYKCIKRKGQVFLRLNKGISI